MFFPEDEGERKADEKIVILNLCSISSTIAVATTANPTKSKPPTKKSHSTISKNC